HGRSPDAYLAPARKETETVIAMKPNLPSTYYLLGRAYRLEALFEWENGRDAHAAFERALVEATRDLATNAEAASTQIERATTLREYAETLIDEGKDATAQLAEGRAAIDKAIAIDGDNYVSHQRVAELELLRARSSRAPAAAFAEAERALVEAERRDPANN